MTVKFRKFGYHVEKAYKGLSFKKNACKHSKSHVLPFEGRYCPSCDRNIVEPKVEGRWRFDKASWSFHRDDNETVNGRVFYKMIGRRTVKCKEGYKILNQIVEERLEKNMKKRNKRIIKLAKAKDIEGLRKFVKNDPYKPEMFTDKFMEDDEFALMVCKSLVKISRK